MPCPNGKAWCPGPTGFGNKCQPCQKQAASPSSGGLPQTSVPMPTVKGVTTPSIPPPIVGKSVPLPQMPATKAKTVIPLPTPEVMATPVSVGVGRSVKVFRGDTRLPGEIKRVGFERWGESIANVSKAGGIAEYISKKCVELKNGASFADWVRATKDRGRPTISTAHNEGCGGYDSGYIYMIEMGGLQQHEFDEKIMPPSYSGIAWKSGGLQAYIDGKDLASSRNIVIDLKLGTEEWAFFTNVPSSAITEYKEATKTAVFAKMSGVQVITKKLW